MAKKKQIQYAGFWIRLAAKLIDLFILALLLALPFYLLNFLATGSPIPKELPTFVYIYIFLWFIIFILYDIYFIKKYNATPGKMIMRIKVVKADNSSVTWATSIVRWIIYKLGSGWWVLFLGVLWIIWDEKKQGWHDKVANTYVIRTK